GLPNGPEPGGNRRSSLARRKGAPATAATPDDRGRGRRARWPLERSWPGSAVSYAESPGATAALPVSSLCRRTTNSAQWTERQGVREQGACHVSDARKLRTLRAPGSEHDAYLFYKV